ncbi:MAG: four helix bundle protein [Phycisphaerales bacterium]
MRVSATLLDPLAIRAHLVSKPCRAVTSIGANDAEPAGAASRRDFIARLRIAHAP